MTDLEPGDRPITIYACLPSLYRDYHDRMIVDMMRMLREAFPEVTYDWEETP